MTFRITKDFAFSASHQLENLPEGHPCTRLHGHNYVVRVALEAEELNDAGMVWDYGNLAPFKSFIDDHLDHRHLNELIQQPTAENLARMLGNSAPLALHAPEGVDVSVGVSETPKTWAWWTP